MAVVPSLLSRPVDLLLVIFFVLHIPITLLVDSQSVIPREHYPEFAITLVDGYLNKYHDPLVALPPEPWFASLVWMEITLQLPFFFAAIYAFAVGASWIRKPAIVYGFCVATTVVPCLAQIWGLEGKHAKVPLTAIYLPYLVIPLALGMRMLFAEEPFAHVPVQPPKRKKR